MSTKRTITLTDRPPVSINEKDWPCIASASYKDFEGQYEFQSTRKWSGSLRVRAHKDGRCIVYGVDSYETEWQGEHCLTVKGGKLLAESTTHGDRKGLVIAIHDVAADMMERGASEKMGPLAFTCVSSLPAEEI